MSITPTQIIPFEAFEYQRPDMVLIRESFEIELQKFDSATDLSTCNAAFEALNLLRVSFLSAHSLCSVRHTINTLDAYYEAENNFFDQNSPAFQALNDRFYQLLVQSKFRGALIEKWGAQLFRLADMSLRSFDIALLEDLQLENKLSSAYTKLRAGAKIKFRQQMYNLSTIVALEENLDRPTRRGANKAKWRFYAQEADVLDQLLSDLVAVRHKMAQTLKLPNFVALGYLRMNRSDYTATMVNEFRQQVAQHIVPMVEKLYQKQAQTLGIKKLKFFDEPIKFLAGNPKPMGEAEDIIAAAGTMYSEMSSQTDIFFKYMQSAGLMDLVARDGKATGGYCTFFNIYKAPFIFSNFNGTSGDVDVLTHEAGHAFQVYSSRDFGIVEYNWPSFDACEIHSMSMEFFAWPWMHLFFGEKAENYKQAHLASVLQFLPYGVAVDAFQHIIYEHPEYTPAQRHAAWRDIEKTFLPHRDYTGFPFLEEGRFWQKQSHIYQSPFYYIDYVLAQFCAFQYLVWHKKDPEAAWASYLKLCEAGGSKSFLELVAEAGLRSPFEAGCVADLAKQMNALLEK